MLRPIEPAATDDRIAVPLRDIVDDVAGVAVRPLTDYAHDKAPEEGVRLVLGYAHVAPARIHEGVRLMAQAAAR